MSTEQQERELKAATDKLVNLAGLAQKALEIAEEQYQTLTDGQQGKLSNFRSIKAALRACKSITRKT